MSAFDHEKLNVSVSAIDFIAVVDETVEHLPRGRTYLADELQRAGRSVPPNIAEGAGESSGSEKARFYRMAKRSATECAAIMHVCQRLNLIEAAPYRTGRELLLRIAAMLVQMVRSTGETGSGTGAGTKCGESRVRRAYSESQNLPRFLR